MIIIDDFVYCKQKNKFYYLPTGDSWKVGGIDAVCESIEESGKSIRPTEWIKKHACIESMPERKCHSPLDC